MDHRASVGRSPRRSLAIACLVATSMLVSTCGGDSGGTPGVTPPAPPEPLSLLFVEMGLDLLPSVGPVRGRLSAVADLDGDGHVDIAQPADDHVRVLWGGSSGFEQETIAAPSGSDEEDPGTVSQAIAADFDGDGRLDLFLVGSGRAHELWRVGSGQSLSLAQALPAAPTAGISAVAVDIDGNGTPDVVVTESTLVEQGAGELRARVLVNDGEGRLVDETQARLGAPELHPYGVAAGDLDGDGFTDLFFTGDRAAHRLLLNDGSGVFRDAPPDALPADMPAEPRGRIPAMGDIDRDGALDVVIPSAADNAIYRNDGSGRLYDETAFMLGAAPGAGRSALVVDLDLDAQPDVVIANPSGRLAIYRNDGSARLFDYGGAVVPVGPTRSDAVSVGAGDFDGDGDPDLFVSRADLALPWLLVSWYPNAVDDDDLDGVPDEVDVCPGTADPEQSNRDASHFSCASGSDCAAQTGCELALGQGTSAYLLCRDVPLGWAEARAFCQARGADLVVVDSEAENELLTSLGIESPWIGLSDTETEGTFVWVSGESLSFAPWAEGEPNDTNESEDCVNLWTVEATLGQWNDADCAVPRAFVCEDVILHQPADPGDECDTCPAIYDPDQEDSDDDGTGDACDTPEETPEP